ncbi:hypothetical protein B0H14DRAFT_2627749 [Mycena olivaceomarginata]|nr:hypothetical protein B0H14DRAFT_2627749 [Mycena olivaceomarginata]
MSWSFLAFCVLASLASLLSALAPYSLSLFGHIAITVSGQPVAWDAALEMHNAIDGRWKTFASTLPDITKKNCTNGPTSSMFLAGRRPVFIPNAATVDLITTQEGRASEYENSFNLMPFWVTLTSVTIVCQRSLYTTHSLENFSPMWFHHLHRLGDGLVMNVTLAPMAYSYSRQLNWDYRLVNITVLGRREDNTCSSPTKYAVKRKVVDLSLDDSDEDDQPSPKKTSASAKSSADGKSGATTYGHGMTEGFHFLDQLLNRVAYQVVSKKNVVYRVKPKMSFGGGYLMEPRGVLIVATAVITVMVPRLDGLTRYYLPVFGARHVEKHIPGDLLSCSIFRARVIGRLQGP